MAERQSNLIVNILKWECSIKVFGLHSILYHFLVFKSYLFFFFVLYPNQKLNDPKVIEHFCFTICAAYLPDFFQHFPQCWWWYFIVWNNSLFCICFFFVVIFASYLKHFSKSMCFWVPVRIFCVFKDFFFQSCVRLPIPTFKHSERKDSEKKHFYVLFSTAQ